MQLAKWGNSLALRIPKTVIEALRLKEGDQVEVRIAPDGAFEVGRDESRARAIARIREMAVDLPPGWKFDREEANVR